MTKGFDPDTLYALQQIYKALMKLEGGMGKLAEACGSSVAADILRNNAIGGELHALRHVDRRIWPGYKE